MNNPTPEQLALRGLLLLVVEVQNLVREGDIAEVDEHQAKQLEAFRKIEQLIEASPTNELVQLARAALDVPASRETFYAIVCQQDIPINRTGRPASLAKPMGPLLMETYFDEAAADRENVEARIASGACREYGWRAIATVTFDRPAGVAHAPIPAAQAGVHN